MKNLDLDAFGVKEMTDEQMAEVEGGVAPLIIAGIILALACIPQDAH